MTEEKRGKLTVVYGPMFSGKTTEIIQQYEDSDSPQAFKPSMDNRYGDGTTVHSHADESIPATLFDAQEPDQIIEGLREDTELVLIDEVQFVAPAIIGTVQQILEQGRNVTVVGLDLDSDKQPFGETLTLAELADEVKKLVAQCYVCAGDAIYTKALFDKQGQVEVGAADKYVPSCEKHHVIYEAK